MSFLKTVFNGSWSDSGVTPVESYIDQTCHMTKRLTEVPSRYVRVASLYLLGL